MGKGLFRRQYVLMVRAWWCIAGLRLFSLLRVCEPKSGDSVVMYQLLRLLITEDHVWLLKHSLHYPGYVTFFYCLAGELGSGCAFGERTSWSSAFSGFS